LTLLKTNRSTRQHWKVATAFLLLFYIISGISCGDASKKPGDRLEGFIARPDISPDGTQLVFVHAPDRDTDVWEIYSSDSAGNQVRRLTYFKEARIKKGPVWSPDGKRIAFHADIDGGAQLFVMDRDGKNLRQLTDLPGYNVEPSWSQNGAALLFNSILPDGKAQMYTLPIGGGEARPLHRSEAHDWYPKQTLLGNVLFSSDREREGQFEIYAIGTEGLEPEQLTHGQGASAMFPEISPDGHHILFNSNRDDPELSDSGEYNLYMIDRDGSNLKQLTDLPGQELHAKWFPYGDQIIFESFSGDTSQIMVLEVATGHIRELRFSDQNL